MKKKIMILATALLLTLVPNLVSACSGTWYVERSNAENFFTQALANCPDGSSFKVVWV